MTPDQRLARYRRLYAAMRGDHSPCKGCNDSGWQEVEAFYCYGVAVPCTTCKNPEGKPEPADRRL
jgi:hypothetical protein